MTNRKEKDFECSAWECFIDQLNSEELEQDYLVLWDYTDQEIDFYYRIGFHFYYEAVIDGYECAVVSQSDDMVWLDEEWVERYWDGDEWVETR